MLIPGVPALLLLFGVLEKFYYNFYACVEAVTKLGGKIVCVHAFTTCVKACGAFTHAPIVM